MDSQRKKVGVTLGEATIEHPFSTYSAPFGTCWQPSGKLHSVVRCAAMLVMLFTIGSGNVWGAEFAPSNFSGQGTSGTGSAISATVDGVTFACDKGYGTTQFRCYKGGKITISSSSTITAISFTFSSNSYKGGLSTSYTGLSTTSWTFTLTGQARITACTVTVAAGCGEPKSLTNGAVTASGQPVSWTAPSSAPANGYIVVVGATSTPPGDITMNNGAAYPSGDYYCTHVAAGTTNFTFGASQYVYAGTEYHWWVRSKCSSSDYSDWVAGTAFTIPSSCTKSVSLVKGTQNNATLSFSETSVETCSSTSTDRQVTVSVTPNTCYAAPVAASVTASGTSVTKISGPTKNGSTYDYVFQFDQNANGSTTFNVSLSTKTTYTVSYAAGSVPSGGSSITGSHANDTKTCGTSMALPGETFHTTGYTQTGWSKTNSGSQYAAVGGSYTDNAAQTFYPVWTANKYTVTWSVNGSTYQTTSNVLYNTTTSTPANPSVPGECTGSTFMGWTSNSGWASDSAPGDLFNGTSPTITGNITFYAVFADEK